MRRADARFELVRALGRGGMGHVDLVRDRESGELLARKRLHRLDAPRLRALKHELRIAGRLAHPNLVRVYELGEDASGPFLLMEAIDGVDVLARCARDGADARAELAALVPQLVSALRFLHLRGVVHGDLSPANVLVRRDGVVKLLDFGLSAAAGDIARTAGGTPGYLAPERLAGAPPSAEADLFSLGALLGRALGATEPRLLAGEGAVERTIRALLDPRVTARPTLDDLERELLPALGAPSPTNARHGPRTGLCRDALAARTFGTLLARVRHIVVLRGPSGIGKTWLARAVASRAAESGASVSWARAHPELRLPFNAIDGLVDDAAERLASSSIPPLVREAARRASGTFPALSSLSGQDPHAERVRGSVRAELFGRASAPPSRQRLFDDVRRVLEAVDPRASMRLLVIDDLHWADGDSLAFLTSLLDTGARSTVLATVRDRSSPALAAWLEARGVAFIDVPPAPLEDVVAWLEASEGFDTESAARVARACEGLPALVELALRAPGSVDPLGDAVRAVVRDGSPDEKQALARLLVADTALSLDDLGVSRRPLDLLMRRGLVSASSALDGAATAERFGLVHDTLRDPLRDALGSDWLRVAHARRADALAQDERRAERIRHLLAAAEPARAAALAQEAADDAARAHAHDLAAELYGIALGGRPESPRSTRELQRRRAEALSRAMRFEEAAVAWEELSASHDPRERSESRLARAHALLAARRIGEGRAALDAALRDAGEPGLGGGRRHALTTIARFLLGPARLPYARVPDLAQAERYLRSAPIAGYFDTVTGLDLLLRARESFDRAGAREQAAWCDFILAFFARFGHPRGASLSARYRRAAERRLTRGPAERPLVRAFPTFLDAYGALREARFAPAIVLFDRALEVIEGTAEERSFEAQLTSSLRTSAVLATQDVDAAEAAVARFEALARDGVDVAIQCHVENARALVWTWRGRFEEAIAAMDRLRATWPREPATIQSILIEAYAALPDVLLGNAPRARARLEAALDAGRRFRIFGTAYGPIVAGVAALTELSALRLGETGRVRLDLARGWAELAAARPSVMTGLGHRVLAYLDEREGRPERALARLQNAEREAERLGQPIDAALARFARGTRLGRPQMQASARAELAAVGASARLFEETRASRRVAP